MSMKAAVRVYSLTLGGAGSKTLQAQELHGKRMDQSSKKRRVRDREPLVYGSLNLREAYDRHIEGAKMNKGLKRPVLHAVIQFPTGIPVNENTEQNMMAHAIRFINQTHGDRAVFAARLDRDENGQHTVDVFYAPKYEKTTKQHGVEEWISTTKHGKELCEKHREEITRRSKKSQFATGPRQVGIALQSELAEYLSAAGLKLEPKREKENTVPDRVDPETFKSRKDAQRKRLEAEEYALKMRETADQEWSLAAKSRMEAESVLKDSRNLHDTIMKLHDRVMTSLRHIAEKLRVSSSIDEIESAAKDIRKHEIDKSKQRLDAIFMKRETVPENSLNDEDLSPEDPSEETRDAGPGF